MTPAKLLLFLPSVLVVPIIASAQQASPGRILAWGYNGAGQSTVSVLPAGLSYVDVFAGGEHTGMRPMKNT
jgi:hypothetical protein